MEASHILKIYFGIALTIFFCQFGSKHFQKLRPIFGTLLVLQNVLGDDPSYIPIKIYQAQIGRNGYTVPGHLDQRSDLRQDGRKSPSFDRPYLLPHFLSFGL